MRSTNRATAARNCTGRAYKGDRAWSRPRFGRLLSFVEQPQLRQPASIGWSTFAGPPKHFDLRYVINVGTEAGRNIDGSLRTTLDPIDQTITTQRSIAVSHLASFNGGISVSGGNWEQIVVDVDRTALVAQYGIRDGYEITVLKFGDRIASSVVSVFDAEHIDARFTTRYETV